MFIVQQGRMITQFLEKYNRLKWLEGSVVHKSSDGI